MAVLAVVILALACVLNVNALYSKSSPVLQVTGKTYDSLIAKSNHTSIVEFYAPWCGHCKNLQPIYEKAAKSLAGLAKVAAIDCDDESNKALCGSMGVQGFPTLKIVRPGAKPGRPVVEDYVGERSVKAIVGTVKDKLPNHVKKLQGEDLATWLEDGSSPAKAVIFTDKGVTSPLVKSLAVDFLGSIAFAQVRDKTTAETYGISEFPSIQLFTSPGAAPVPYIGDINRVSLVSFFSQVAPPNPDPAPKSEKPIKSSSKKPKPKPSLSASAAFSEASEAHKSSDFEDHLAGSSTIILDDVPPTESPLPIVEMEEKPMVIPDPIPPIVTLATPAEIEAACLLPKSGNCILVLLPREDVVSPQPAAALAAFGEITDKYNKRKASVIPMFAVPAENQAATMIRSGLELGSDGHLAIIATNMKRGWWRNYQGTAYDVLALEDFVDAIKLGEGIKMKLPTGFGLAPEPSDTDSTETADFPSDAAEPELDESPVAETDEPDSSAVKPEPAETPFADHDEL